MTRHAPRLFTVILALTMVSLTGPAVPCAAGGFSDIGSLRDRIEFLDPDDTRLTSLKTVYRPLGSGVFLNWDDTLAIHPSPDVEAIAIPGLSMDGEELLFVQLTQDTSVSCWFFGIDQPESGIATPPVMRLYNGDRQLICTLDDGAFDGTLDPPNACEYCAVTALAAAYAVVTDSWVLCGGTGWVSCATFIVGYLEAAVDILVWCAPVCE